MGKWKTVNYGNGSTEVKKTSHQSVCLVAKGWLSLSNVSWEVGTDTSDSSKHLHSHLAWHNELGLIVRLWWLFLSISGVDWLSHWRRFLARNNDNTHICQENIRSIEVTWLAVLWFLYFHFYSSVFSTCSPCHLWTYMEFDQAQSQKLIVAFQLLK